MTFWQWLQAHWGAILLVAFVVFGAAVRALPAKSTDFQFGQFVMDWLRGILQQLPSTAPKLTPEQKLAIGK